jgi:hypothetical protein
MDETPQTTTERPRRRLMWSAVIVALVAGLGALGLSIYNTARFDERVKDYVTAHKASLVGAPGPVGPRGATGPEGPRGAAGPQGAAGKDADPLALQRYNNCLESGLASWMRRASITNGAFTGLTLSMPPLVLSCG